jgi:NitT/TauT family transport system ATP-binding protein
MRQVQTKRILSGATAQQAGVPASVPCGQVETADPLKPTPAILCRQATKSFGSHHVLDRVDLTVPRGAFHSLIGPSGCGKTTLLRAIAGLTELDDGDIQIHGDLARGPDPRCAVVFQNFGLFPWKNLHGNVAFGLVARNFPRKEIEERTDYFLNLVGLGNHRDKFPYEVSGGMQQRAGLARAFAVSPEVLLMDEPFGSVDALTRSNLHDELLSIWEVHQCTVLFVTHSIEEAIVLSDRIAVMAANPGHVIEQFEVRLPRPRREEDVRDLPEFIDLRKAISLLLRAPEIEPKFPEAAKEVARGPRSSES